jgi:hypothetical protein
MKIIKNMFLISVVFCSLIGQAQQLFNIDNQVVFGGDNLDVNVGVIQMNNGTYVSYGATESSSYSGNLTVSNYGMYDLLLINYNSDLTVNWQKNYGGSWNDFANDVIPTSDGGFIVLGGSRSGVSGNKSTPNYGWNDIWLIKCDANGNKQWEKIYGGNYPEDAVKIKEINNNYYIFGTSQSGVTGNKTSPNKGGADYWVIKTDNQGNIIWDKSYGGSYPDYLNDVIVDENNNIYLAGYSSSNISGDKSQNNFDTTNNTTDIWVVKINANGDIIWDKSYGDDSNNANVSFVKKGNYVYLAFNIYGSATPNSGNVTSQTTNNTSGSDFLLMKLDTAGNILWDKNYGGDLSENLSKFIVINNSLILAGLSDSNISGNKTENSRGGNDAWFVLLNKDGDVLKDKTIGTSSNDYFNFIYALNYNRFFIGFNTNSGISGDKTLPNYGNFGDIWIVDVSTTIDLGIKETETANKIIYGPNPTHNHVTFTNLNKKFSYLSIYNIQGKIIIKNISIKNLDTYKLNLNVTKGIYFVKLTGANNAKEVAKIIVN